MKIKIKIIKEIDGAATEDAISIKDFNNLLQFESEEPFCGVRCDKCFFLRAKGKCPTGLTINQYLHQELYVPQISEKLAPTERS